MKNKKIGRIFVISAPSGSGKTTLCDKLLKEVKGISRSISMTTRKPRKGERSGKDYYFVTEKQFKDLIRKKNFLEWARNFGHFYGTPRAIVEKTINKSKDIILSIDVQGAMQIKKTTPGAVFIFISPPSFEELKKRLRKRNTDHKHSISKRLRTAKKELNYISKYDYIVINDSINKAIGKLKAIIMAERCRII